MTLAQIRAWLLEVTGRNDLSANDSTSRPGFDKYIQAGSIFLDGKFETPKDSGVVEVDLAVGDYYVDLDNFRAVKQVWIADEGSTPLYLAKTSLEGLHGLLEQEENTFVSVAHGTPRHYAVGVTQVGDADPLGLGEKRIVFLAPSDAVRKIYVSGLLWSTKLVLDTDVNFWSSVMPHTLVEASWMMIERAYRNREGVNDHLAAIFEDITQIDFDVVEQDIAQIYQMRSTW